MFKGGEILDDNAMESIKGSFVTQGETDEPTETDIKTETKTEEKTEEKTESKTETKTEEKTEEKTEVKTDETEKSTNESSTESTNKMTENDSEETTETEAVNGTETETQADSEETTKKTEDKEGEEAGEVVYWLKSGSVWHVEKDCWRIAGTTNKIYSGTVVDAQEAGKDHVCSSCGKKAEEKETNTEADKEAVESDEVVYWLESGSVWHIKKDCWRMAGTTNEIFSGTVADAQEAGKDHVCSSCGKKVEDEETDTEADKENVESDGIVYWLESGSVWHIKKDCWRIAGTTNEILSGTVEDARKAGAERVCSSCGKNEEDTEEKMEEDKKEDAETDGIVFWLEASEVWHVKKDCWRLAKTTQEIFSGTIDEAKEAGVERVCSSCGKKEDS